MRASGPPFYGDPPMCKCGWKWASDCKSRPEHCGLVLGMPKTEEPSVVHTPYEFLPEEPVDLDKVCREVVEDLVKEKNEKKTLRDLIGDGGWDHYKEYPDGSCEYMGKSHPKWDSNGLPVFTGWDNTEPVTYLGAKESSEQVGGTHYAEMSVQPWDFYKSIFSPAGYCDYHVGSIISYLSRHRKKGEMQDLEKALHHLKEIVRYFKEEAEYE